MNGPHCTAITTKKRAKKTKLGYATFFCSPCKHIFNERTGTPFNYTHGLRNELTGRKQRAKRDRLL